MVNLAIDDIDNGLVAVVVVYLPVRGVVGDLHAGEVEALALVVEVTAHPANQARVIAGNVVIVGEAVGVAKVLREREAAPIAIQNKNHFFYLLSFSLSVSIIYHIMNIKSSHFLDGIRLSLFFENGGIVGGKTIPPRSIKYKKGW